METSERGAAAAVADPGISSIDGIIFFNEYKK
jgi:hypothetical protein